GTEVFDVKAGRNLDAWHDELNRDWDREKLHRIFEAMDDTAPQPEKYQNPHKTSWYLRNATPQRLREIEEAVRQTGLAATIVYSSARDLDILPAAATKGGALRWLCKHLGIPLSSVVVAGDTGNDSSMFLVPGVKGIAVQNAQPELLEATIGHPHLFHARQIM